MMRRVKPTTDRTNRGARAVQGKRLLVVLLGGLLLAIGLVFYMGLTGGSTHMPLSKSGVGFRTDPAPTALATADAAARDQ